MSIDMKMNLSLAESQKGVHADKRWSIEKQKGAITIGFVQW